MGTSCSRPRGGTSRFSSPTRNERQPAPPVGHPGAPIHVKTLARRCCTENSNLASNPARAGLPPRRLPRDNSIGGPRTGRRRLGGSNGDGGQPASTLPFHHHDAPGPSEKRGAMSVHQTSQAGTVQYMKTQTEAAQSANLRFHVAETRAFPPRERLQGVLNSTSSVVNPVTALFPCCNGLIRPVFFVGNRRTVSVCHTWQASGGRGKLQ